MGKHVRIEHDEFQPLLNARARFRRKVYNLFFSVIILMNIAGWLYLGYIAGQKYGVQALQMQAIDMDLAAFDAKTATWGFLTAEQVSMQFTSNKMAHEMQQAAGQAVPPSIGIQVQEVQDVQTKQAVQNRVQGATKKR